MTKETKVPVPAWAAGWDVSVSVGPQGQRIALEAQQIAVVQFPGDDVRRAAWSERTGDPPDEWKDDHVRLNVVAEFLPTRSDPTLCNWLMVVSGERDGVSAALSARVGHGAPSGTVNRILRRLAVSVGNALESAARAAVPAPANAAP